MKKALIDRSSKRVFQVEDAVFPVHSDLEWVDVPEDTTTRDTFESNVVVKEVAPPSLPAGALTAEGLATALVSRGLLSAAEIEAVKPKRDKPK